MLKTCLMFAYSAISFFGSGAASASLLIRGGQQDHLKLLVDKLWKENVKNGIIQVQSIK